MADDNTPQPGSGFPDADANNAAVAAKLAAQDINGKSSVSTAEDHASTFDALDKLVEEKQKAAEAATPPDDEAAKKAAEEAAAKKAAEAGTPPDDEAAKKAAEEAEAAKKAAADAEGKKGMFDDVQLPPNARPRSAEAFATIKERAAKEIETRDRSISELTEKLKQAEERISAHEQHPVPEDVEKELKELREFRAKMDVEVDPKFKEYDKAISVSEDFIYAQLKKHPQVITAEVLAEIKKFGGPTKVKMDKIFAAIGDPMTQRLIESKLADIETQKFSKEQAITAAKERVSEYLAERQKSFESSVNAHNEATAKTLAEITAKFDWLKEATPDAKATAEEKKAIEDNNKFAAEVKASLKAALHDDTPHMRAILLAGMAQFLQYQRVHEIVKAERDSLKKQVAELSDKLGRFKSASVSRLRESGAAPGAKAPEEKPKDADLFHKDAGSALDDLARKLMESKASA